MGLASALAEAGIQNAENSGVTQFVSTGFPPLDNAIAASYKEGGFPAGRIIEMFGPPSAGKTAIASSVMANAQKMGGFSMFQDHENSFDEGIAVENGLSTDPDHWVYNKPDTFEKSIDQIIDILFIARGKMFKGGEVVDDPSKKPLFSNDKPVVVVIDSLASCVPQSTIVDSKGKEKDAASRNMNDNTALARATSAHLPRLAMIADRCNAMIVILNQIRTKMGVMYGDPTTTPGGGAPEFYASVRIKLGRSILTIGEGANKRQIGQRIGADIIKNKVRAPFKRAEWDFLYGDDGKGKFDVIGGCIDELVKLGKVEQAGAWTTWDGKKWNSRPALRKHIEDNGQLPQLLALFP